MDEGKLVREGGRDMKEEEEERQRSREGGGR